MQTPAAAGLFVPTSTDDRWIYAREWPGAGPIARPTGPPSGAVELLRAGTGLPDLAPRIDVGDAVHHGRPAWRPRSAPAAAFLVGDAAHRTTPVGGIGMNTAIHAAHNLGWKLAWVLRGWAGEALLDSYEAERLADRRRQRAALAAPGPGPTGRPAWDLGVRYTSAVLGPGAGGRAPHAWVRRDGTARSPPSTCSTAG